MNLGLENKVAVVSAASKGLGKAVALELAREGCKVAICARGEAELEATKKELASLTTVFAAKADITDPEEIRAFISATRDALGHIDILVTNAGGPPPGSFSNLSEDDWRTAVELNLMSVVRLTELVLPDMKAKKWGRIVNLTSVSVKEPIENLLLSNAIRPGVVGLAKTLSREVGTDNITINCVAPGYTATERLKQLAASLAERDNKTVEDVFAGWTNNIPLGRLGEPEELAALTTFLCSERAGYITGTTIQVDGGLAHSLL